MSFFAEKGADFEICPSGMHLARCYRLVDIGTQQSEYMGTQKFLHKITLAWEVHGTDDAGQPIRMLDGRPFGIFKNYTLSWSEKANLRLDLQSWRGKPFNQEEMQKFDLKNILGVWCMLNVIEHVGKNGNTYANIAGISPVPGMIKAAGFPTPVNPVQLFSLQNPDMVMFETFSNNLKAKIESSPEWKKLHAPKEKPLPRKAVDDFSDPEFDDEEIPF